ncbi:autotransporter outer membrane beta-barrel domain-containing protein [Endozoicomonas sp.]|uniref:autotransporter outer membrane beta-barrel domain-containing protein n=1 Tax=Endozoicomonas sp. TaxID=1892382 RepID=UPI003AF5E101
MAPTTITTSNQGEAISNTGGIININAPLTVNAKNNTAIAVDAMPSIQVSTVGTRATHLQPANPQIIRLNGQIQLLSPAALVLLDLSADSQINSRLNISEGEMLLSFDSPHAQFSPVAGSTVGSKGALSLNFENGGLWQMPLTAEFQNDTVTGTIPLTVQSGGQLSITGSGTIQGLVSTTLEAGNSQTYVLVKTENVDASYQYNGIDELQASTNTPGYKLNIEQQTTDSSGYLLGVLTREENTPGPRPPLPATVSLSYLPHQALPVSLIDQLTFRQLLNNMATTPDNSHLQTVPWVGINSGEVSSADSWYLQVSPFLSNLKGKDYNLYSFDQSWKADTRGLGLQLLKTLPEGYVSAGFTMGDSNGFTKGLPESVQSNSNYRAVFLGWSRSISHVDLHMQTAYLNGRHNLQQSIPNRQLQAQVATDLTVAQATVRTGLAIGDWRVLPSASLSWWNTQQSAYRLTVDDTELQISGGRQHFWQATPRVDLTSPLMPTVSPALSWQITADLGHTTVIGEKNMSTQIRAHDQSPVSIPLASPMLDKHYWQSQLGLHVIGKQLDAAISYCLDKSQHLFSQAFTASVSWLF